jgi:FlaA1/EpsC-like NDP-sugar epimerase
MQSLKYYIKKIANWYFSKNALPYYCILAIDAFIILALNMFGFFWQFGVHNFLHLFWYILLGSLIILIPFFIAFKLFHTYSGIIRFTTFIDLSHIAFAMIFGCIGVTLISYMSPNDDWLITPTAKTIALIFFFGTALMCAWRIAIRLIYSQVQTTDNYHSAFIYGTKSGGIAIAKSIINQEPRQYTLKGFITPLKNMQEHYLMGVKIYSDDDKIADIMKQLRVKTLLVSPLQTEYFRTRESLINKLIANKIKIMIVPLTQEKWDSTGKNIHLQEIDIEDLLPRDEIDIDLKAIGKILTNKKILITGAAGSIGSEIVRQVSNFEPAHLILIDQAETPMHDIRISQEKENPDIPTETIVTSITNQTHMEEIFEKYRPDYVFHAAAYKHVPMMEDNPAIAVQNNIYGTRIIADLAVKYGTKKFVMISTDKAVNPTNVMGCSKRICEIYCQSLNEAIKKQDNDNPKFTQIDGSPACTHFVTTRFGNVLGSNGSVIPLFREQIKHGGPVTVTHPDIIRYFMLIPEACKLVLEAGALGKGGEIFVFDMGKPVRIADLAQRMIDLSGAPDIKIEYTGLRDGEKLFEEVLNDKEQTLPTSNKKIKIAKVREYPYEEALQEEQELLEISKSYDDMAVVKKMKEIVPEYKSQQSKYEVLDNPQNDEDTAQSRAWGGVKHIISRYGK